MNFEMINISFEEQHFKFMQKTHTPKFENDIQKQKMCI